VDSSQVRARIIEVGQLVKKGLIERGVGAAATEPDYKYVGGEVKPRRSPFWSRTRGKLMVHFHQLEPEVWATLPLLQPAYPNKEVKKLSLISREVIGQALTVQQ
jgi:hypothetical protein